MTTLEEVMDAEGLKADPQRIAWLAAAAARVAYQMEEETKGQTLQTRAFTENNNHSPPRRRANYTARPAPSKQSRIMVERLLEYDQRRGIIADFGEAVSALVPEASASRYEESLCELGAYLGFQSERPENVHGVGPDVLWRTNGDFDFVIEAKSKKEEDNPLYKRDHAQLLEAEHWFKQEYPNRKVVRVSALPEAIADEKATPAGSFAFRLEDINYVAGAVRNVLIQIAAASGNTRALEELCEVALREENLTPKKLRQRFMRPFGKRRQESNGR